MLTKKEGKRNKIYSTYTVYENIPAKINSYLLPVKKFSDSTAYFPHFVFSQ